MPDQPTPTIENDQQDEARRIELARKLFSEAQSLRKNVEPSTDEIRRALQRMAPSPSTSPKEPESVDQPNKLIQVAKVMCDNFSIIDRDGDNTLSQVELEQASKDEKLSKSDRKLLTSASRNVALIAGMWHESSNSGATRNPLLPARDTGGISRYDLYTMQHALSVTNNPDPFNRSESGCIFKGVIAGLFVGAPLCPFAVEGGARFVERYAPKVHSGFGALLGGAFYVGIFGGSGGLAASVLKGDRSDFYDNRYDSLTQYRWVGE